MIRIGFTGSRHGASEHQRKGIRDLLAHYVRAGGFELHHGDCLGADADADEIARELGELYPGRVRIVVHPPTSPSWRAWTKGDENRPPRGYFERNRAIVDETELVLACPLDDREVVNGKPSRGGTWWTVRYARERRVPWLVVVLRRGVRLRVKQED